MPARVLLRLLQSSWGVDNELFGGTSTSFETGARRSKKHSRGADHGKDSGWIFRRVGATVLGVERVGTGEKESEADKQERGFLHSGSPIGKVLAEKWICQRRKNDFPVIPFGSRRDDICEWGI